MNGVCTPPRNSKLGSPLGWQEANKRLEPLARRRSRASSHVYVRDRVRKSINQCWTTHLWRCNVAGTILGAVARHYPLADPQSSALPSAAKIYTTRTKHTAATSRDTTEKLFPFACFGRRIDRKSPCCCQSAQWFKSQKPALTIHSCRWRRSLGGVGGHHWTSVRAADE